MPTHPEILGELAARYGGCDPSSPQDVTRFYTDAFRGLPRRQRDRISFEILHRDGEQPPVRALAPDEVTRLDRAFDIEDTQPGAQSAEAKGTRRVALAQARFSALIFIALVSLKLAPELISGIGHGFLAVLDLPLLGAGLLGNVGVILYERWSVRRRGPIER